jgi:hypothetical protein
MLTGCASILGGGGSQPVEITSQPSGAQIQIRDSAGKEVQTAMTPCRVTLDRGKGFFQAASYTVHGTSNGLPDREVPIKPGLNPWYLGNFVFGGIPGFLIVDPLTGAMWNLPTEVKIDFNTAADGSPKP